VGLRILSKFGGQTLPQFDNVALNLAVFGFAVLLSLTTGLVFGGLPAMQISRMDPMEILRDSSRSTTAGGRRLKIRGLFVIGQVALALVLLIGAGLMTHTLLRLNMIHPGFDPHGLATVQIPFPRTLYRTLGPSPTGGLQVEMSPRLNTQVEDVRNRIANLP